MVLSFDALEFNTKAIDQSGCFYSSERQTNKQQFLVLMRRNLTRRP